MVWGTFVGTKLLDLVVVEGKMNSAKCIDMLDKHFRPFMKRGLTFMQDGANIHSAETKDWLENKKNSCHGMAC